jgi:hypothetical protein
MLLYIDPGTGSMLFSLFIGIATTAVFVLRAVAIKLKFVFSGGKQTAIDKDCIPYVIFCESKRYWNVFKPICDEFETRKIVLVYYTASSDDPVFAEKYEYVRPEFIGEGNKAFAKMNFLNADVCLSTTPGLDVYQWKRSKTVKHYAHIPHSVDDLTGYRMFGLDRYDSILSSGAYQEKHIRMLEQMRNLPAKEYVVVGCTYLDAMKKRLELVKNKEPASHEHVKQEKLTILVAPSWGPSAILSRFGKGLLDALVQADFNVVVRPHPQSVISEKNILDSLVERYKDNHNLSWNYDNDNFDVLANADLLITDFSGIIFDFTLLFDKSMIYADTKFDSMPYDADWIEEPMWKFRILPELGIKLEESAFPKIKEVITQAIQSKKLEEGRNKARNEAWKYIGESAGRVVDFMVNKQIEVNH